MLSQWPPIRILDHGLQNLLEHSQHQQVGSQRPGFRAWSKVKAEARVEVETRWWDARC